MSLRSRIEKRILTRLLALVGEDQTPNLNALNDIVKNVRILELNMKAFGYDLARKMATTLPVVSGTRAAPIEIGSKACVQADIESEWCAHWAGELKTAVVYHRKLWELTYVLQALYEHGQLTEGRRGLGFGCGAEPIPSYLASLGIHVTATDVSQAQAQGNGWLETGQHLSKCPDHHAHLVDAATFERMVANREVDMNAIPADLAGFDFCWSICALEHLGSIAKGLAFIEASLATLRPGGVAVHTLEFNVENDGPTIDNWITVLFQQRHLEALATRLRDQGHRVEELNFDTGSRPMDQFIDLPPWHHDPDEKPAVNLGEPLHLKLAIDGFVSTSFGLIVKKGELL